MYNGYILIKDVVMYFLIFITLQLVLIEDICWVTKLCRCIFKFVHGSNLHKFTKLLQYSTVLVRSSYYQVNDLFIYCIYYIIKKTIYKEQS